jgi:hypothetical protein
MQRENPVYHFCTYFDQGYLIHGLALYRSLVRHVESFVLYVLCLDEFTYKVFHHLNFPNLKPISVLDFERGDQALLEAKKNRSRIEYYFTCTPSLPLYIFDNFQDVDLVTYLDADLFCYGHPAPIFEELGNQSILIVEHRFPEHLRHMEKVGIYNVSLLSFRNDARARDCLKWWRERCLEWCYQRVEENRFADQKYLNDLPQRFSGVVVQQHKGSGLAPWNVCQYNIQDRNGRLLVDSDPLIFYHFNSFYVFNSFLYRTELETFGARLEGPLLSSVYVPYIRELQSIRREIRSRLGGGKFLRSNNWKDLVYSIINGRVLLLVLGPIATSIDFSVLSHPVTYLRGSRSPRQSS